MFGTLYLGAHQFLVGGAMHSGAEPKGLELDNVDHWVMRFVSGAMPPVGGILTDDAMSNGITGILDCVAQNVVPELVLYDRPEDARRLVKSCGLTILEAEAIKIPEQLRNKCGLVGGGETLGLYLVVAITD